MCVLVLFGCASSHEVAKRKMEGLALEEEEPITAATIAGALMVEWAAGTIYDFATAQTRGTCLRSSKEIDTFSTKEHRIVGDDMLRFCQTSNMRFVGRASEKKKWNVHARHWTVRQCLFDVEWQFSPGASVYDCTRATIERTHGIAVYKRLRRTYADDKFFTRYVAGLKVDILDCDLNLHKGYVHVYPSLPRVAFKEGVAAVTSYRANPYFHINVELWTGGSCSGSKAPGVKWVFTYQVDPAHGTIKYITVKDDKGRPKMGHTHSYLPHLYSGATMADKKLVVTYKEKTKAKAEKLGIDLEG